MKPQAFSFPVVTVCKITSFIDYKLLGAGSQSSTEFWYWQHVPAHPKVLSTHPQVTQ